MTIEEAVSKDVSDSMRLGLIEAELRIVYGIELPISELNLVPKGRDERSAYLKEHYPEAFI